MSFGPMGASVDVVGRGHNPNNLIPENVSALGKGLVLQREIHYFRESRNNVDVVKGEVLPAYVQEVREDGRLNISLREPGGKAKTESTSKLIMKILEKSPDGTLFLGDKSAPEEVGAMLPGVSKIAFKKAVAALYKEGKVKPGPLSISLMDGIPARKAGVKAESETHLSTKRNDREPGAKAKAQTTSQLILKIMEKSPDGTLLLGETSTAEAIDALLPGVKKSEFNKAVATLVRQGKVEPGPRSIMLLGERTIKPRQKRSPK
jgi:predicted RNA-binding protein (virulence factor B family)